MSANELTAHDLLIRLALAKKQYITVLQEIKDLEAEMQKRLEIELEKARAK